MGQARRPQGILPPWRGLATAVCLSIVSSHGVAADAQRFPPPTDRSAEAIRNPDIRLPSVECDEEAVVREGHVMIPPAATEVTAATNVDEDRGPVSSLYPNADTSTDGFYPLPCDPSLGGSVPPAATQGPTPGEAAAMAYVTAYEASPAAKSVVQGLGTIGGKLPFDLVNLPAFVLGNCHIALPNTKTSAMSCDDPRFLLSGHPFEGRDIIFVHGLATEHLKKRVANDAAASRKWPGHAAEFLGTNGYFRTYARKYWKGHIEENLYNPSVLTDLGAGYEWTASQGGPAYRRKANRHLVVSWSSNQTIEYAQHTLLTQIMLAMTNHLNVVTPLEYPQNFSKPFCANGCIIVSHSTGGEIVSSAMARAKLGHFGNSAKIIPQKMRAHVAFAGATSGSRLASLAMAIATTNAPSAAAAGTVCAIEDALFETNNTCALSTTFVASSILRDLVPAVAQNVWGPLIALSPVPTVTVAGGHPTGNYAGGVTKILLPGLDDGVVSMNSACGNPLHVQPGAHAPSGATMLSPARAFDLGIPLARAVKTYISQKDFQAPVPSNPYFAAGCTPYLSTAGMVMPVANPMGGSLWDSRRRYPNHFSFIQGSIDHSHDGGSDASNPWPSTVSQPASVQRWYRPGLGVNAEEMSAVTDHGIYAQAADGTYLVHPAFAGEVHEYVRGRKFSFKLFGKQRTWWLWKRTYHLLRNWPDKSSAHFVYEFVARR